MKNMWLGLICIIVNAILVGVNIYMGLNGPNNTLNVFSGFAAGMCFMGLIRCLTLLRGREEG